MPSLLFAASLAVWAWVLVNRASILAPLPTGAREPVSWPALPVCATFLVAFLLPVFAGALFQWLAGPGKPLSLAVVQWQCAVSLAQIVTIVGLLAIAKPLRAKEFGCDLSRWRGDLLAGVGGFLASLAPVFYIIIVLDGLEFRRGEDAHTLLKILDANPGGDGLVWIFLSAVVFVPPAEELLYRVLLQGWSQSQITPASAILFSSTIFCLSHQPVDVLPLAPLAAIMGFVYYRRQSYLAVVVLHALFNATNLTLAALKNS